MKLLPQNLLAKFATRTALQAADIRQTTFAKSKRGKLRRFERYFVMAKKHHLHNDKFKPWVERTRPHH